MRLQFNEILGIIKDNEIDRWRAILKIDRVNRMSGFSVDNITHKDREIADNNLKLFFTYKTQYWIS